MGHARINGGQTFASAALQVVMTSSLGQWNDRTVFLVTSSQRSIMIG